MSRRRGAHSALGGLGVVLAALVSVVPLLLLVAPPASACSCAPTSRIAQARVADVVVAGIVDDVLRDSGSVSSRLTIAVDVDRVHKGGPQPEELEVSTAATSASCGLGPLPTGERYVFFLLDDGARLTANLCGGTGAAGDRLTAEVERTLGPGTAPGTPSSDPVGGGASLTRVADGSDPPDVVRAVLPGGLLAAAGLLGLLLLLSFGSRRR